MKTSDNFREILLNEINYVAEKMEESSSPNEQLYYFSALYAMVQRIYNIEYDPDLVYAHFILNETYKAFQGRMQAIQKGGENVVPLHEAQFMELTTLTKELADKIKAKKNIDKTLKKFVVLLYTTTGNGYYLFQKGMLKI